MELLYEDGRPLPKSHKAPRKPETELKAAQKKAQTTNGAIVNVTVNNNNQTHQLLAQVEPFNRSFWEYKFEINMPESILNFLRTQEEILSESSNERLLPPLPWQSKMATAAKILDRFLSKFADEGSFRMQESTKLHDFPSHELLKVRQSCCIDLLFHSFIRSSIY